MVFYIPSKNPRPGESIISLLRGIDWAGIVLVTTSLALFTLALSFGGNQFPWKSGVVIGFFTASGVLAILFGLSQTTMIPGQTKERRIFPNHYFRNKDMVLLAVATAAGSCGMFIGIVSIGL